MSGLKFHERKKHGESIIWKGCVFDQSMSWVQMEEKDVVEEQKEWQV